MPRKNGTLWHKIKRIKSQENRHSLRWHVLNYIQKRYREGSEIEGFFRDLLCNSGCQGGMIPHLVYYTDTHKFFDKYYEDIEELREEYEESRGEPLRIKSDLKNFLAWFAFEETVYRIANDFGFEI